MKTRTTNLVGIDRRTDLERQRTIRFAYVVTVIAALGFGGWFLVGVMFVHGLYGAARLLDTSADLDDLRYDED